MSLAGRVLRRASRAPFSREVLWRRSAALAKRAGIDRAYLVLSFDCDTDRDAEVVTGLDRRLAACGMKAAYAVPGAQLLASPEPYAALLRSGNELLAHGFRRHTEIRGGSYTSTLFYDDLDARGIADDVLAATRAYQETLGARPAGFRAPHFGSLGTRRRAWLYAALAHEGYRFSTSTLPAAALRQGPVYSVGPLVEIPLSGRFDAPLDVLDSYNFRFAPGRPRDPLTYTRAFTGSLRWAVTRSVPLVLNTYADPSQVHDWPPFWAAIEAVSELGVPAISYARLLDLVEPSLRAGSDRAGA